MVERPVAVGMRVLGPDGTEIGTVIKIEVRHFVVSEAATQSCRRFTYDNIRIADDVVELTEVPEDRKPRRRLGRRRARSTGR